MRHQIFEIRRSLVLKGAQPAPTLNLVFTRIVNDCVTVRRGMGPVGSPLPVPVTPGPRTVGLNLLGWAMTVATARITPRIGYDRFLMWNMNKRLAKKPLSGNILNVIRLG